MSDAPVIEARGLKRVLPGPVPVTLVAGIDLAVARGEFLAVTGPSGSGKSSLLYLLGLLDVPSEGEVLVEGRPTAGLGEEPRAALRLAALGFVFQFHFLLPEFTALGNVMLPMRALGRLSDKAMAERAAGLLAAIGLEAHKDKTPDKMSGGQRQRVAIARALANQPKVILADEPTGNLDSKSTEQVFDLMARLSAEHGTTLIVVTHDLGLAARADRRIDIVDGRIAETAVARRPPAAGLPLLAEGRP